MVPNSNQKQQIFRQLLKCSLPPGSFEVTDVKRDDTVVVRCKSTEEACADEVSQQLVNALDKLGIGFTQTDDTRFRVPLASVGPQ